ncbi:MAG: hypothetical protein U0610_26610 [bacterium]
MHLDYRNVAWWYWLATVPLVAASLARWAPALPIAVALTAIQALHFRVRTGSARSFPVQVRLAYLTLLLAGAWEPLAILHWIQLVGTTAMVTVGYCPLARCLSLLPWNRSQPVTAALLRRTFLSPPVRGSILAAIAPAHAAAAR